MSEPPFLTKRHYEVVPTYKYPKGPNLTPFGKVVLVLALILVALLAYLNRR